MGVVGSLPLTNNTDIQHEHPLPLADGSTNNTMSVIPDIKHDNPTNTCRRQKSSEPKRCSIHRTSEGADLIKRRYRSRKNREKIRKLTAKRQQIRDELRRHVQELELKQKDLLSKVGTLYLCKQQLLITYQQINSNEELIE